MATLLLQVAGQAAGAALGPVGALAGRAAGALAGRAIDQALFSRDAPARHVEGPRLKELDVQSSSEGSPIPRIYGRARLAGQLIWATRFEEDVVTRTERSSGGKYGGGSATTTTSYRYYANFALGLCEGPVTRIGRVWADGKLLDTSTLAMRIYNGAADQLPDPLIEAKEGAGNAPAYRGLAYVVFERLALENFGNRLPQLSFEVFRAIDVLEQRINAVTVIPGTTEFGYDTQAVSRQVEVGHAETENSHAGGAVTDWTRSMDDLAAACENLSSLSLVVSWFGSDLRCGTCLVRPGIDSAQKVTTGRTWQVGGLARSSAQQVSLFDGRPAFGGTPADASVIAAIQDIAARGKKTVFYPFLMMDIAPGNALPDPYGGSAGQPAYPWRGRITCDPAPGVSGSPDKSAAALAQIQSFFGTCAPSDFTPAGDTVTYHGPAEWSYRRMVLHYAHLCALAGGVDAFLLGSELKGLAQIRDSASHYPFAALMAALAGDVRAILGPDTKISYGADWSDYFGHHPQDGSGDVFFHLDGLWACDDIDFVAIDNYMPLADWRDGEAHADALAGASSPYDLDYLRANIAGGEGYDWYYASEVDRDAQIRTPITDGAHGKPWVFRFKDLTGWWLNQHFDRPGGIEAASPTAWVPQSKPVWFTEAGCPAIDKGANQPNVFHDPKSAESAFPHYSSGARDDLIQRRHIEALLTYWNPADPAHLPGSNPVSTVYGGPMVDPGRIHIWTWDARPHPYFPYLTSVWADGPNWERGHWINGRIGAAPLDRLVAVILGDYGFAAFDAARLRGVIDGYVVDRPMSAREALEPLGLAWFFDALESGGEIAFRHRDGATLATLDPSGLAAREKAMPFHITRAQESELPVAVGLNYMDGSGDYRIAAVESRRLVAASRRDARADLPIVTTHGQAQAIADSWLQDLWVARETSEFVLPPSRIALEVGDIVDLVTPAGPQAVRLSEIADGHDRQARGRSIARSVFRAGPTPPRGFEPAATPVLAPPHLALLDIPALPGGEPTPRAALAALSVPWPGAIALYRSRDGNAFEFMQRIEAPGTLGELTTALEPGPTARWDRASRFQIRLYAGTLAAATPGEVLAGANLAAIRSASGGWEIIQFAEADLIGANSYQISMLLRGQAGSEAAMAGGAPAGSAFVLLDGAIERLAMSVEDIGIPYVFRFGPASRSHGDASYGVMQATLSGQGLKPFSPVHVRGRRLGGDVLLSWIRRSRAGGDNWDQVSVPLGEESEAYEVDILDAGNVLRTLSTATSQVLYAAGDIASDFGDLPQQFEIDVYQLSPTHGRGTARRATIHV